MIKMMTKFPVHVVPLGISAHDRAKEFSLYQANLEKAKQVYLNTLTVWSVKTYINLLGWQTNLKTSDSWNPMFQSFMDVADLDILDCGKIECVRIESKIDRETPVTAARKSVGGVPPLELIEQEDTVVLQQCNGDWVNVPAEVKFGRIGYIAVELSQSLQEAKLLGFVSQLNEDKIFLPKIQSLEKLPTYLEHQKHRKLLELPKPVKLSQWLDGIFERSWQRPDKLALPENTFSFRSTSQLTVSKIDNLTNDAGITRVKLIELESIYNTSQIALILNIKSQKESEIEISVKVSPTYICTHLPYGLEIMVLDEREQLMMQAQAKNTESIEFRFSGEIGEKFSIKVSLHNFSKGETFII